MTKATPKKKTTTTKKKSTVKAHRGFAHVPLRGGRRRVQKSYMDMTPAERAARRRQMQLGRERFLQGREQPFTPAMRDLARRQSAEARKRMQQMTPAQRDAAMKQIEAARRRQQIPRGVGQLPRNFNQMSREEKMLYLASRNPSIRKGTRITAAQRDRMRKQLEAEARKRQLAGTFTTTRGGRPKLPIRRRPTVEQLSDARRRQLEGTFTTTRPKRRRPVGDPKPRKRPTTPKQKQRVVQATQAPRTRPKSRRVI